MSGPVFTSKRHDTAMSPVLLFAPPEGTIRSLTDTGVTVKFIARMPGETTPKIESPAVVLDTWTVRYDPTPTDVDTIGAFDVEVEALWADGKKATFPTEGFLQWVIVPDLDNA